MDDALMKKQFQKRLKVARNKLKLTQEDVESRVGKSSKTIGGYENGRSEPDLFTLAKLALAYEVTADWLITGKESERIIELEEKLKEKESLLASVKALLRKL